MENNDPVTSMGADIGAIVALNGGKLAGKIRLQKTIYLLQQSGTPLGYEFEYYHYGPYSEEVSEAAEMGRIFGYLTCEARPGFHSIPYSLFEASSPSAWPNALEDREAISAKLKEMDEVPATVLELAATIHFLHAVEDCDDPIAETKLRKPKKATDSNLERAMALLQKLGFQNSFSK